MADKKATGKRKEAQTDRQILYLNIMVRIKHIYVETGSVWIMGWDAVYRYNAAGIDTKDAKWSAHFMVTEQQLFTLFILMDAKSHRIWKTALCAHSMCLSTKPVSGCENSISLSILLKKIISETVRALDVGVVNLLWAGVAQSVQCLAAGLKTGRSRFDL
jgi:hypothetical protein